MRSTRLRRLLTMRPAEAAGRLQQRARVELQRTTVRLRTPRWDRRRLARALSRSAVPPQVLDELRTERWEAAHGALVEHWHARPGRFLLAPTDRARVADAVLSVHPQAAADARARAVRIGRGALDVLGYEGLQVAAAGDQSPCWHADPVSGRRAPFVFWADVPYLDPASGDHKVIWEVNRHQYWLELGRAWWLARDAAARRTWIGHLRGWLEQNPPLIGINWASALELAFRCLSWLWVLHIFTDEAANDDLPWTVDVLLGLDRQLGQVEATLSHHFSPNTHLLGEALALYVCSQALPELAHSPRRAATGRRILIAETARQVRGDGGHAEQSPHYHRYALDFYLLALSIARITGDRHTAAALEPTVDRMATWMRHMAADTGRLPLIGDDDGGELFPIAGLRAGDASMSLAWAARILGRPALALGEPPEAAIWVTADERSWGQPHGGDEPAFGRSVRLEESGYLVLRQAGSRGIFDCGPHGFLNGGHAHADALALTLEVDNEPLFVDPGTGTYTMDAAVRERFRSTRLHNTLVLDGRSQADPAGPFHWAGVPDAEVVRWVAARGFDYAAGRTTAWLPVVHERHVLALDGTHWVVADRLTGAGTHDIAVHWHVAPSWVISAQYPTGVGLTHASGGRAHVTIDPGLVETVSADPLTGLGWIAPVYGRVEPARTILARCRRGLPLWLATVVRLDGRAGDDALGRLEVQADEPAGASLALAHRSPDWTDVTLIRAAGARDMATVLLDPRQGHAVVTDARMLHLRLSAGAGLVRVSLADFTVAHLEAADSMAIRAAGPIPWARVATGGPGDPVVGTCPAAPELTVELVRHRPQVAVSTPKRADGPQPAMAP